MSTLFTLFLEFFKTGLFAIGGGLATIPFLSEMATKYPWFSQETLSDMIAIAESTPGPIGVNMATYAGYTAQGIIGGIVATAGLITPAYIITVIVAKIFEKFKNSTLVQNAFYGLRPAVAGLISAAAWSLFKMTAFDAKIAEVFKNFSAVNLKTLLEYIDFKVLALFAIFTFVFLKFKKIHPILLIAIGALCGIVFKMA
ncbi:MAG: chromate transporter [Clostridia bacterium]|nr:chromate transporter [Clostridia bacterium]